MNYIKDMLPFVTVSIINFALPLVFSKSKLALNLLTGFNIFVYGYTSTYDIFFKDELLTRPIVVGINCLNFPMTLGLALVYANKYKLFCNFKL